MFFNICHFASLSIVFYYLIALQIREAAIPGTIILKVAYVPARESPLLTSRP
jgi:hypothetical protein